MKFSTVVSVLAVAVASVSASAHAETNAARLARGLPPKPPVRRGYRTDTAYRGRPSSTPPSGGQCNVDKMHCCESVSDASGQHGNLLKSLLGIVADPTLLLGVNCSPLSVAGIGGTSCNAQPVCCTDNHFNGLIVVGCSPINVNL